MHLAHGMTKQYSGGSDGPKQRAPGPSLRVIKPRCRVVRPEIGDRSTVFGYTAGREAVGEADRDRRVPLGPGTGSGRVGPAGGGLRFRCASFSMTNTFSLSGIGPSPRLRLLPRTSQRRQRALSVWICTDPAATSSPVNTTPDGLTHSWTRCCDTSPRRRGRSSLGPAGCADCSTFNGVAGSGSGCEKLCSCFSVGRVMKLQIVIGNFLAPLPATTCPSTCDRSSENGNQIVQATCDCQATTTSRDSLPLSLTFAGLE